MSAICSIMEISSFLNYQSNLSTRFVRPVMQVVSCKQRFREFVVELHNVFSLRGNDGPGAEVYTDMLLKNMTPYITTQVGQLDLT